MFTDLVKKSRTIRSFDEASPVGEKELYEMIDCARMTPCARNPQPFKYCIVTDKETCSDLVGMTRWAAALPEFDLPPVGHYPTAFIAVCLDTGITPENGAWVKFDAGIAAQTIMLKAAEMGYGGCILGSFSPSVLAGRLGLDEKYVPVVLLALGKPCEKAELCEVAGDGNISYFRNADGTHFVPKRELGELIIK